MENRTNHTPEDKGKYIRASEIPAEHRAFIEAFRGKGPARGEGEEESYYLHDYMMWLEQWESEGGLTGPLPE